MSSDDVVVGGWDGDSIGETRSDLSTGGATGPRRRASTVRVRVSDNRRLDERRLRAALTQLVRAVNVLHQRGLLHLDIKPSNIIVGPGGRLVLLDFGLVRSSRAGESDMKMTLGTPAYMAPEQAAGEPVGSAADWYAVGGVLYRALTGVLPFTGGAADVMLAKQLDAAVHPRTLAPDVPEDLANLAADLLCTDPSGRPSGREVWARLGEQGHETFARSEADSVFVGRRREWEALSHALATASKGTKVVVRLAGAAAVGKTTLVRRVLAEHRDKIFLLDGETFERESLPFVSFDRPVDSLAQVLQRLGPSGLPVQVVEDVRALSRMFPVLGSLVPEGTTAAGGQVGDSRARGAQAFCRLVAWLSTQGRLPLLWIDSAHWSDRDSALLMRTLLSSALIERLLVILSYRRGDGADSPLLGDLDRLERARPEIGWRQLDLLPLPDEDVKSLARALLSADTSDEVVDAIALESAGNPLFVGAICRYGRHLKGDALSATELSLHHVVAQTFEALDSTARRLLETLAVCGRPMSVDMLFSAALLTDEDRVESVEALLNEQMVATHQGKHALMLSVAHDKTRELIVAWIEPEILRDLHRSIAEALARDEEDDPERLMYHFAEGGELARAGTFAVMAAGRALDALAFDSASRLFERAIGYLSDAPANQQVPIRIALADALRRAGDCRRAAVEHLYAADLSAPEARARLRVTAAEILVTSGRLTEGLDIFGDLHQGLDLRPSRRESENSAPELKLREQFGDVLASIEAGLGSRTAPAQVDRLDSHGALARGLSLMLPARSGTFWAQGMLDAYQSGDEAFLVHALGFMAIGRAVGGTLEGLEEAESWMRVFDLGVRRLDRRGLGVARHLFDSITGLVVGDYPKVKRSVARVRGLAERYSEVGDVCLSMTHAVGLERRWMMGGLRTLFEDARRIQRFAPRGGDNFLDVLTESYLALEDLASNAPVDARQRVRAAQDLLDEGYFTPLHYLTLRAMVWCDLYDGESSAAYWRLEGAWPQIRASGLLGFRAWSTEIQLTRGLLMLTAARDGTASSRRAVSQAEKSFANIAMDRSPLGRGGLRQLGEALLEAGSAAPGLREEFREPPRASEVFADGALWLRAAGQRWSASARDENGVEEARRSVHEALAREGVRRPEAFLRIVNINGA